MGSDHRGYAVKQRLLGLLAKLGHEVRDFGVATGDGACDYPDYAIPVSEIGVDRRDGSRHSRCAGPGSACASSPTR